MHQRRFISYFTHHQSGKQGLWLSEVKSIASQEVKGPSPSFDIADVIIAIITINRSYLGRKKLSSILGLGEGAVRTLLSRLKEKGIIETYASGCRLTEKGLMLLDELNSSLKLFQPPAIISLPSSFAGAVAKKLGRNIGKGLEERDAAVRAGAEGALILVARNGRIVMPELSDFEEEHLNKYEMLMDITGAEDDDLIIITWAKEERIARRAAIAAITNLIERVSAVQ